MKLCIRLLGQMLITLYSYYICILINFSPFHNFEVNPKYYFISSVNISAAYIKDKTYLKKPTTLLTHLNKLTLSF